MSEFLFKRETFQIIGAAMEVHKNLGCGFLEAIYQEALELELILRKIPFVHQKILPVYYKEYRLNKEYVADLICFDEIIVELKALSKISGKEESQLLNYMTATKTKVGLILNFGAPSLEYKRMVR